MNWAVQLTQELKQQIERILRWEPSEHWRQCDFAALSQQIMVHTNQWLESHDLQTFWRSSDATPTLLDTLAQFADYDDFNDFCARNQTGEMVPIRPNTFYAPSHDVSSNWVRFIWWFSASVSAGLGLLLLTKR